jgi:two-component system phosphate regulon sensor histidine kinase PhoR
MNKHKFTGILLLMSISLLGIIAVQWYWMHNAITTNEEQFNQQVKQAMARAALRIERNQNANFISSMFRGMPQIQMKHNMFPTQSNQSQDSLIIEFNDFWQDKNKGVTVIKTDPNVTVETKQHNGMETTVYGFDTVINDGYSSQRIQTYSSVTIPKTTTRQNILNNEKKRPQNPMEAQFTDVMEQMVLEFTIRDIPMEERLSYSVIGPTIEYELKNMGIPLKYEYAIANYKGKIYTKLASKAFNIKQKDKAYKTTLFPNDILMQSDQLLVQFPEKRNYLINSVIGPFSGSLLFTLIILFTFYYTLKTIYNQKKVSEIKTDFINNMTHEFKTPIATISLAADAITNQGIICVPDKVRQFANVIKEENRRMNRQVESVLKMALFDKKDFNLNMVETMVHPLIAQAVKNISLQVEQKGGQINTNLAAANDVIKADETHFVNIIYNLLDNANKYSLDAPPDIVISTYNSDDNLVISVSDKGIGMDKDTQERIFEKFYRVPTGNVHTVKGFGLGLSYVKAIVMQFKGDIAVKSQKGKGSTFEIKLPLKNI